MRPKFMYKKFNIKNFTCEDGTMPCFMFSKYYAVDEFIKELSNRLNEEITKDSYLGYKVLYVNSSKYMKAIKHGIDIILNNKYFQQSGICPLNCYNERVYWDYVQILEADVSGYKRQKNGELNLLTKFILHRWKKKLSKFLQLDIQMDYQYGRRIRFYIKRTPKLYLIHDELLDKIRMSCLIENSPFSEYALLDYYGEFTK